MKLFLLIAIVLALVSSTISCIPTSPPTLAPAEPAPAPTPPLTPEPQPIDIEAYISTPDLQPSYTIADLAQAKAELSNIFKEDYYAQRTYITEKYKPHDLAALKQALADMNQLPWKYKADYFDCSEMSALVQLYLKVAGFDALIVFGRDPKVQGPGHAWNIVFLQQPEFEAVPVEPTSLSIPKATGNVYGEPPNQVVMNYGDYLRSGWVLRDIYEAWVWKPQEFDWWSSYALSMDELFGKPPALIPTPTPAPSPQPFELKGWKVINYKEQPYLVVEFSPTEDLYLSLLDPDGLETESRLYIKEGVTGAKLKMAQNYMETPKAGSYTLLVKDSSGKLLSTLPISDFEGAKLSVVDVSLYRDYITNTIRIDVVNEGDLPAYIASADVWVNGEHPEAFTDHTVVLPGESASISCKWYSASELPSMVNVEIKLKDYVGNVVFQIL